MDTTFDFLLWPQSLIFQACFLIPAASAVVWCLLRLHNRTDEPMMDRRLRESLLEGRRDEVNCPSFPYGAGLKPKTTEVNGKPENDTIRAPNETYEKLGTTPELAEAVRSDFVGAKSKSDSINSSDFGPRRACCILTNTKYWEVIRRGFHNPVDERPQSAAHQVFCTPELLAMILTKLPLHLERNVMSVCRRFRDATNPAADYHLLGIKAALRIKFPRTIESMNDYEKLDLACRYYPCCPTHSIRGDMAWLFNFGLDSSCLGDRLLRTKPFLKFAPFVLSYIQGDHATETITVQMDLQAKGTSKKLKPKGMVSIQRNIDPGFDPACDIGFEVMHSTRDPWSRHRDYSWQDVKIFTMPFKISVQVRVDFREAMNSPNHRTGICPIPGCQVGLHGVQPTKREFTPEEATLGEFISFLDQVEKDVLLTAREIFETTARHGKQGNGESYYMGPPSQRPPRIKSCYKREAKEAPSSRHEPHTSNGKDHGIPLVSQRVATADDVTNSIMGGRFGP